MLAFPTPPPAAAWPAGRPAAGDRASARSGSSSDLFFWRRERWGRRDDFWLSPGLAWASDDAGVRLGERWFGGTGGASRCGCSGVAVVVVVVVSVTAAGAGAGTFECWRERRDPDLCGESLLGADEGALFADACARLLAEEEALPMQNFGEAALAAAVTVARELEVKKVSKTKT